MALAATNCDLLRIDSAASEASIVACGLAWDFYYKAKAARRQRVFSTS